MSNTEPAYISTDANGMLSSQMMLPAKMAHAATKMMRTSMEWVLRTVNHTATAARVKNRKSSQWYSEWAVKLAALDNKMGISRQWMMQPTELAIPIQSYF